MTANLAIAPASSQSIQFQIGLIEDHLMRFCHPDAKPKCSSVSLAILSEEGNAIVNTLAVPPKLAKEELETFAREMAHTLQSQAMGDVATQVRSQRYGIVCYAGERVLGRVTIMCHPPASNLLNAETEGPTQTGLTAMAMRMTDLGLRMGLGAVQQANTDLRQENASLRDYINQLEGRRMEMFDRLETARTQAFERELALKREQRQDERVERLFAQVETLLPALCAKYGMPIGVRGVQAVTQSDAAKNPVKGMIYLYSTLTDAQREAILEVLNDEQKGVFFEAMKGFYAEASKETKPS